MQIKQILSFFLIAGFLTVAVFGVFGMHPAAGQGSMCIASVAKGQPCLDGKGVFESLVFHLSAFKEFSTAVFGGNIFVLFLLFLAPTSVLAFILGQPTNFVISYQVRQFLKHNPSPSQQKFTHWLAIHENSPNFS